MIETTTNKPYTYEYKRDYVLDFVSKFPNKILNTNIYSIFNFEEIASEDFIKNVFPVLRDNIQGAYMRFYNLILSSLYRYKITDIIPGITKEKTFELINRVFEEIYSRNELEDYDFDNVIIMLRNSIGCFISEDELSEYLFSTHFFKRAHISKVYCTKFLDDIFSNRTIEDPESLIKSIQEDLPDYNSFPLAVLNKNITPENKKKIIKMTYRQKDLPQYKVFLRENVKNLLDIDIFLQTTIFENNRVKEKTDNLINFFKDIFIASSYRNRLCYKKFENIEAFSKKYAPYFIDTIFMRKFKSLIDNRSKDKYTFEENFNYLINNIIFASYSTDQKLELYRREEYNCLGEMFPVNYRHLMQQGNLVDARKYIKVFCERGINNPDYFYNIGISTNELELFIDIPEVQEYFKSIRLYHTYKDKWGTIVYSRYREKGSSANYSENIFPYLNLIKGNEKFLGLNFEEIKTFMYTKGANNWSFISDITTDVYHFYGNIITNAINKSEKNLLYAKETFIKIFEDNETAIELANNICQFNMDDKTKMTECYSSARTRTIDVFMKMLNLVEILAQSIYEKTNDPEGLERFKNSMNSCEETLKLLAYIQ